MPFKAHAPGSLMLLGEYGVLYGKHALVCAVDKRITVTLSPRTDNKIFITSAFKKSDGSVEQVDYQTDLANLKIEKPYQFVLGSLKHVETRLRYGCDIQIESEFSHKVGLGSSAAVTVAMLAAIYTWLGMRTTPIDLVRQGRNVVRMVQGTGSGADVAASVYGGMVGFQSQPLTAEKFHQLHPISAVYAGYKTPTVDAIKQVQKRFQAHPTLLHHLAQGIGQCALEGIQAVRRADWPALGEIMNMQQGLMESLGVSSQDMQSMINALRKTSSIMGAKISGAGLGDCVVGLGEMTDYSPVVNGSHLVNVAMTLQGVNCEKI